MGKHIYVGWSKSLDEIPEPSSVLLDHNLRKSSKGLSTKPATARDVPIDAPRGSEVVDHPNPGPKD